jgi:NADPH:quinone reductase
MQAIRVQTFGDSSVLQLVDAPIPEPAAGEVRIRVEAASVNFADVIRRRNGRYPFPTSLPFTPGSEVAGVIDAVGVGVAGLSPGLPVFAVVGTGQASGSTGYAAFAVASATQVVPLPPGMSPEAACGLLVAGTTAMLMLREVARLTTMDRVFVTAAAGGVGSFAVQIARALGAAQVIAGVGRAEKMATASALGAHAVVDYSRSDWPQALGQATNGDGIDVLLEMRGGDVLNDGLRLLNPWGRLVVYGAASGEFYSLTTASMAHWLETPGLQQSVHAFNLGLWFTFRGADASRAVGDVMQLVASGAVSAPSVERIPLSRAAEAHARLESRMTTGKLVLIPEH